MAGIRKKLVRIANREDPDQTASSEAVWSGSALSALAFVGRQRVFEILEHLLYMSVELNHFIQKNIIRLTSLGRSEMKSRWNCGSMTCIICRTWVGSQYVINSSNAINLSAFPHDWNKIIHLLFCLIWFFTSQQQSFSYAGTGLPRLNQY